MTTPRLSTMKTNKANIATNVTNIATNTAAIADIKLKAGDNQAVAATATTYQFIVESAGTITGVKAVAGTTAASGESMTVDVQIGGVSCLSSAITLDATAGTTVQDGTIDAAADDIAEDDIITIVRTYTAGGTPTPMANVLVSFTYQENA